MKTIKYENAYVHKWKAMDTIKNKRSNALKKKNQIFHQQ